jgi:uncharacterized membrane protein YkoI
MNQRTLMMIAAGLTAFVLVLVGGLALRLGGAPAQPAAAVADTALDPTVEALLREREAAYQAALAEANSRLEQANRQIEQANQQLAQVPAAAAPAAPAAAVTTPLEAEQAAQVALAYRGGGEVREVETEQERGAVVYDVKFSDGASVYVDAATGQVVYARLGGEHEEHGFEGHEHDD